MGRDKSALAEHTRGLSQWLLSLRQASGHTISQVAERTEQVGLPTSRSTLYRAELAPASGQRPSVPAWRVVEAYTKACGGSITEARRLWTKAASLKAPGKAGVLRRPAMAPQYIAEPAELLHAMRELRVQAGKPSLRELEDRARANPEDVTMLPRSTLGAVLNGTRQCRRDLLAYFVRACGVTKESEVMRWLAAWDRIEASRNGTANHNMHQRLTALEEDLHHTKTTLATVIALPAPRPETGPVLIPVPVPGIRPATTEKEKPKPHAPEPATAPAASTPARTRTKRTRRSGQWLTALLKGLTSTAGTAAVSAAVNAAVDAAL
ncbi:helix-turn-helix domain-containing protein (plasmid) [Streptomyces sp. NBC_00335]|uniref:helix-turn-helix domain-containing protein n=1 Tax=unclassified Streptomyces TaxID=2593676 RepID=UPI002252F8C7|nr:MULTISPECIES: helix-turn-helix transcriptional regulator [unclassified Streptomyces]MCX5410144.1 helix-turn-helix domain-containing protein [Streptomyces sp. NBC_00086]